MVGMKNINDKPKPTEVDWARLAAYIDGEGAILINRKGTQANGRTRMWLRVVICNTDPRLPIWCRETFGIGNVVVNDRRRKETHRLSWRWQASCKKAAFILENCMAFFIIKREEAELALAFQKTLGGPGKEISLETMTLREQLRNQLHARKRITPLYDDSPVSHGEIKKRGPKISTELIH